MFPLPPSPSLHPQHNFHVHSHLWPQLKFMKSPRGVRGLLGRRPSQERNELIVTLRLLLSISELSTAVDRRRPGSRPSITGRRHQETKQTAGSQRHGPESHQVRRNIRAGKGGGMKTTTTKKQKTNMTRRSSVVVDGAFDRLKKLKPCVKFGGAGAGRASRRRCQSLSWTRSGQPC